MKSLFFSAILVLFPLSFFAQQSNMDTLEPPKTIYLKNRPAPQTIAIPLTPAQAQGKKCINHWGSDTIEQTKEIPLSAIKNLITLVTINAPCFSQPYYLMSNENRIP